MKSIATRADVDQLVHSFYDQAIQDELLAPHFEEVNFDEHMPRMVDFWCLLLLDEPGYSANVIQKHVGMQLEKAHFDRWVNLFIQNLESQFEGEKVNLAKEKLAILNWTMQSKVIG